MDYEQLAQQMVDLHTQHYNEMSRIARQMAAGGENTILHILGASTGEVFAEDLARRTGLSAGRVASILKKLEGRGFIRRTRDEANRRKYFIELTAQGREAARQVDGELLASHEALLRELGPEDAQSLLRIVARLCEICRAPEQAGA